MIPFSMTTSSASTIHKESEKKEREKERDENTTTIFEIITE